MLLRGKEIRKRINNDLKKIDKKRHEELLVITPILDIDEQIKENEASLDLRLGSWFTIFKKSEMVSYDPKEDSVEDYNAKYIESHYISLGDRFILHPSQFALGITLEWVHLPIDLAGYVIGRSSWGRQGLIIATATGVHPGFSGCLVLELSNSGEVPIHLYPGVRIAQLFIHKIGIKGCDFREIELSCIGQTKPAMYPPISRTEKNKICYLSGKNNYK